MIIGNMFVGDDKAVSRFEKQEKEVTHYLQVIRHYDTLRRRLRNDANAQVAELLTCQDPSPRRTAFEKIICAKLEQAMHIQNNLATNLKAYRVFLQQDNSLSEVREVVRMRMLKLRKQALGKNPSSVEDYLAAKHFFRVLSESPAPQRVTH